MISLVFLTTTAILVHGGGTTQVSAFSFTGKGYKSIIPSVHPYATRRPVYAMHASTNPSSSFIVPIDDTNYGTLLSGDSMVLVDACAKWCGPCKLIEPVLERCAQKRHSHLTVARYDIESERSTHFKFELLLQKVLPRSLPSLILFHGSKALISRSGVITDDELEAFLNDHWPHPTTTSTSTTTELSSTTVTTTTTTIVTSSPNTTRGSSKQGATPVIRDHRQQQRRKGVSFILPRVWVPMMITCI